MNTPLQIAIDGPVASGKGDIAGRLAKELQLTYIYTGAMYRMLALACIEAGISTKDIDSVCKKLQQIIISLMPPSSTSIHPFVAVLNDSDVTERIFKQDVAIGSSDVGTIPQVRQWMVARQQDMAHGKSVVMEGRDIGLRVLPNAQLKIYLTASLEERAHRRWLQFDAKGIKKTHEEVLSDTKLRDHQDTTRVTDPLQKLPDAWELDTTGMNQEDVVARIKEELIKRNLL
ncbi:MAG: (d)CMP kinase [Patescibacteria group bacterium]